MSVEVIPLEGLPEIEAGDDLVEVLAPPLRAHGARDGDAIAVTQKIVSKAEGRVVPVEGRERWIERESAAVVARRDDLVIVRTRHGFVCANAGVDASNVPAGTLSLLPEDPDASAERLREGLTARLRLRSLGVVITDTFGRPWREGVVDVAIGCAGLTPLVDLRGTADDRGRPLETTVVALADAVAAAGGLVMAKAARVPAALVRGVELTPGGSPPGPARDLVRPPADDLFRESALVSVAAARPTAAFRPGAVDPAALRDALRDALAAASHEDDGVLLASVTSRSGLTRLGADATDEGIAAASAAILVLVRDGTSPEERALRGGAAIGRLAVALRARGLGWRRDPHAPIDPERVSSEAGRDRDPVAVAVVWVGVPEGGA